MAIRVSAVSKPDIPPLMATKRLLYEVTYFMSLPGEHGIPAMAEGEYWIRLDDSRRWLDEGCFELVSPLASENKTEVELSEEHENLLEWLVQHGVEHIAMKEVG